MNDTQINSLFTELTTEESATINGAYIYRPYAWWRHRRYSPVAYRPYNNNNNNSTTVNVKVKVNVNN